MEGGANVLRGLALFDQELANVRAAFGWAVGGIDLAGFGGPARSAVHDPNRVVDLVDAAVPYIGELRFSPRERIRWLEAEAEAARAVGRRSAEGNALGNLGIAYAALG